MLAELLSPVHQRREHVPTTVPHRRADMSGSATQYQAQTKTIRHMLAHLKPSSSCDSRSTASRALLLPTPPLPPLLLPLRSSSSVCCQSVSRSTAVSLSAVASASCSFSAASVAVRHSIACAGCLDCSAVEQGRDQGVCKRRVREVVDVKLRAQTRLDTTQPSTNTASQHECNMKHV